MVRIFGVCVAAILGIACSSPNVITGEPLLALEGTVTLSDPVDDQALAPVLMFANGDDGYVFVDTVTRGKFIPNLVADVYDVPPDSTLRQLSDDANEPLFAQAYIAAIDPSEVVAGMSLNYWVIYLPEAAAASSEVARAYADGDELSAGYHLFEVAGAIVDDHPELHEVDTDNEIINVTLGSYAGDPPF